PPQVEAVRVGGGDVSRLRAVVERVRPACRTVDELVADHERAGREIGSEPSGGARADDAPDAELPHRPQVRAVGDAVWRQLVLGPVTRQERDPLPTHFADGERRGGIAVRSLDPDRLYML